MKILYIGCVKGSVLKLEYVIEAGGNVIGVITLAPSLKARHADFASFENICDKKNIPLVKVEDINTPSSVDIINKINPDIIFVFGWSQIVKKTLLDLPTMGVIGFHPTLLPKNRGRHPIIWTLVNGLHETGVTFFFMDEGVDSGDIIAQKKINVDFDDDVSTLMKKVNDTAGELIQDFVPKLANNTIERIPQNHSHATYLRKRVKHDGYINWQKSSIEIYNLVRALTKPYPGASAFYNGKEIKIWKCRIIHEFSNNIPGTIHSVSENTIIVQTGNGALEILEAEIDRQSFSMMMNAGGSKYIKRLDAI